MRVRKNHVRRVHRKWTQCGRKAKFTKTAAWGQVRKLGGSDNSNMHAYPCPFKCRLKNGEVSWHVGHNYMPEERRRK